MIQTSVVDDEVAPDFATESRTRATLTVSGWQLLQQGNNLKVTYVVKIALNGSVMLP